MSCDAICVSSQSMMAHGQHEAHIISGTVQTAFVCVNMSSCMIYICVQLRSWVQKVLHIPIKIKVVVFYFKLYKYIV